MEGPSESLPEAPDAGLVSYLATHDAACPRCRYNLRGVEASRCPECGTGLSLTLARPRRLGGWGPFLLVVFGWLLLAGSMSTARNVQSLHEQQAASTLASARIQAARTQLAARLAQLQKQPDPLSSFPSLRSPGSEELRRFQAQANQNFNAMLTQQLQTQLRAVSPAAPAPTLLQVWQGSGWRTKTGSIWSAAQGVGGLLGLLVLGVIAVRGRGPLMPLVVFAYTLFTLYVGWHIVVFVNDMR